MEGTFDARGSVEAGPNGGRNQRHAVKLLRKILTSYEKEKNRTGEKKRAIRRKMP